jgi:hypothetical protein
LHLSTFLSVKRSSFRAPDGMKIDSRTSLSVPGSGSFFKRLIINTSVNKSRAAKFYWHTLFICSMREKRAETLARALTCARLHARCFIFAFYLCRRRGKHGVGCCRVTRLRPYPGMIHFEGSQLDLTTPAPISQQGVNTFDHSKGNQFFN